jgi:hypothetical protein
MSGQLPMHMAPTHAAVATHQMAPDQLPTSVPQTASAATHHHIASASLHPPHPGPHPHVPVTQTAAAATHHHIASASLHPPHAGPHQHAAVASVPQTAAAATHSLAPDSGASAVVVRPVAMPQRPIKRRRRIVYTSTISLFFSPAYEQHVGTLNQYPTCNILLQHSTT